MNEYSINKIITPTVLPLQDDTVTAWSEHLSHNFRAKLLLYNAVGTEGANGDPNSPKQETKVSDLIKSATATLRDLGDSMSTAHRVSYVVEVSNHWRNLIRQVHDEAADLLVTSMPAQGEPTPGRMTSLMYNSPCPVFFVRKGMPVQAPKKILLPLRASDGFEEHVSAVISWAQCFKASIFMSTFIPDGTPTKDKLRLLQRAEQIGQKIRDAEIELQVETTHGYHFGTTMIKRAKKIDADLIAVCVRPTNYLTRLFTKMVGPFFLENSPIPVLSLPLMQPETEVAGVASSQTSNSGTKKQTVSLAAEKAV